MREKHSTISEEKTIAFLYSLSRSQETTRQIAASASLMMRETLARVKNKVVTKTVVMANFAVIYNSPCQLPKESIERNLFFPYILTYPGSIRNSHRKVTKENLISQLTLPTAFGESGRGRSMAEGSLRTTPAAGTVDVGAGQRIRQRRRSGAGDVEIVPHCENRRFM